AVELPLRPDAATVDEDGLEPATIGTLEPGPPGSVRELDLHLTPGHYEVFCNMAGHYLAGMSATFTVEEECGDARRSHRSPAPAVVRGRRSSPRWLCRRRSLWASRSGRRRDRSIARRCPRSQLASGR